MFFMCFFCSVLKSQRHILKVMKWWCGDVSGKGEYEWQQSEEKQVRPFLLQPSLHSVQKPKEYPFWSPLFVETNSIGIQTKLNQWKCDIERKTSFEAWTNSLKKCEFDVPFPQRRVFPWIISCWQETLGRTSYRMPLTAMWPCCWRGMRVREVRENSEVIWHFLHFRMNIGTEKSVPQKEKEHLFFSTDPTGSILVFRGSLYWCIDLGVCVFWYGGRFLKCIGSLSNIDLEKCPPLRQYTVKPGWIFLMALKSSTAKTYCEIIWAMTTTLIV